jgi:hypothetical protein
MTDKLALSVCASQIRLFRSELDLRPVRIIGDHLEW